MSIHFKTSGSLDIATGPPQLPDDGLQRAKNVNLDTTGDIKLRRGSHKIGIVTTNDVTIDFLIEHGGDRYYFDTDGNIYINEATDAGAPVMYEGLFDSNELRLLDSETGRHREDYLVTEGQFMVEGEEFRTLMNKWLMVLLP
jgi:hypothetical protein